MEIHGVSVQAERGIKLNVRLQTEAVAIDIFPADREWFYGKIHIFLPVADYERAKRAVESFNAIMADAGPTLIDLDEVLGLTKETAL